MRWLLIGDSILEGMAPHLAPLLEAAYPEDAFRALAHEGWSTRRWIREGGVRELVHEERPGRVVIMLGTNDEGEERGPTGYAAAVRELADQAGGGGATVYWITAFSGTGTAARLRIVRRVLPSAVDGVSLMRGVEMRGEIHPAAGGYRLLALHVAEAIVRLAEGPVAAPGSILAPLAIGATLAVLALVVRM